MVTRAGLRYTRDYLTSGICSLIKPAAMEKLMSFRAKIHTVMLLWCPNTTSASTIETHHIALDRRRLEVVIVDVYIINDARVHCLLNAACDKYKINGKPIIVSIQSMPCLQVRFYNTGAYPSWNMQVPFALKLYSINPNRYLYLQWKNALSVSLFVWVFTRSYITQMNSAISHTNRPK